MLLRNREAISANAVRRRASKRRVISGSVIEIRAKAHPSSYWAAHAVERETSPPHDSAIRSRAAAASLGRGSRRSGVIAVQPIGSISSASDRPERATTWATSSAANRPSSPPPSAEEQVAARLHAEVGLATDHGLFDESVPAGLHDARAARGPGSFDEHRRTFEIINDHRPRKTPLDEHGPDLFGPDNPSLEFDQCGPVAIAVQGDTEVGLFGHHAAFETGKIGVRGGIRGVPGEIGVDGATKGDDPAAGFFEHPRRDLRDAPPIASTTMRRGLPTAVPLPYGDRRASGEGGLSWLWADSAAFVARRPGTRPADPPVRCGRLPGGRMECPAEPAAGRPVRAPRAGRPP